MAVEKEVEKGGPLTNCNLLFDESGFFLLYATALGVKVVNLHTNALSRTIGKTENIRMLHLALFQVSIIGNKRLFYNFHTVYFFPGQTIEIK